MELSIHRTLSITTGGKAWVPNVKDVDGAQYLQVQKYGRSITKFLTGKTMNLSKAKGFTLNGTPSGDFIDHLCELRTKASHNQAKDKILECDSQEFTKEKKKRKITAQDELLCPVVTVTLPPVQDDKVSLEGMDVKMLFGLTGTDVWVEAEESVIRHIVFGLLHFKKASTDNEIGEQ